MMRTNVKAVWAAGGTYLKCLDACGTVNIKLKLFLYSKILKIKMKIT